VHIVVSSGLVDRRNSYYRIQDVSADKLVSATHVSVQGHKGGQNRFWTSIFVPERHPLKCLDKSLVYLLILFGFSQKRRKYIYGVTLNSPAIFTKSCKRWALYIQCAISHKQRATNHKLPASSYELQPQGTSYKLQDASYTLNPALFGSSFVWQIPLSLLHISLFKVTQKIFQPRLM
jgi:hypothetical protein